MAVTVSTPAGDGSFVTRKLKLWERISSAGRVVCVATAVVFWCVWMYFVEQPWWNWSERWLEFLLGFFVYWLVMRTVLLGLFPRKFPTAPSSPDQTPLPPSGSHYL